MASKKESNQPLYRRLSTKEVVFFRSSLGKVLNDGNGYTAFTGELALNSPLGTYWPTVFVQAGALVLTVGEDALLGGFDRVKITADGNTIDLDPAYTWILTSGGIDASAGATNIITAKKVSDTEIEYSVVN